MPPGSSKRLLLNFLAAAFVVLLLVWSWFGTDMNVVTLMRSAPRIADFLSRMFPPDLTWDAGEMRPFTPPLRLAATAVAVTLQIALLGTALGTVAAFGLGLSVGQT